MTDDLDDLAVNTVRALAMDAVQQASSGHPGTPMALAPLGYALFTRHLRHNPADPRWPDRDRFVLSAGHASMLLYALLHLTGYDLPLDELRRFRQLGGRTPGHPENFVTVGVETTTGPLGQGFGNAVGMALAERLLAERFNRPDHRIVDHRTWVIASDGDLMEGVASEAASLAGQLRLDRLAVFWDDNGITIDGSTSLSFDTERPLERFAAYGWRTLELRDGNDLAELDAVLSDAAASDGRPTLVRVPTVIGYGAPNKAGTAAAHGAPLGQDEIAAAKTALGWPYEQPFTVPDDARSRADQTERGKAAQAEWEERFAAYASAHPELAAEFERVTSARLPEGWSAELPEFPSGRDLPTRKASGSVINALAPRMPELVGGSADLASSNNTTIDGGGDVGHGRFDGRNLHFGVREHAMGAAANGLALHGGVRPFVASFLIFTDYLRPALRLAAMMRLPVVYVMTHDSVGLGEDGPTHQPVEHLAALRAIPHLHVVRPADARETAGGWAHAVARTDGPTLLALTRQAIPTLAGTDPGQVARGAYVVATEPRGSSAPDVVLLATGSEVAVCVEAADTLTSLGVTARVVSMPCWELFDEQSDDYRRSVLPSGVPVLSVEAATSFGWSRWADAHVALDRFGVSAPAGDAFAHFGFTGPAVADAATGLLRKVRR